MSERDYLYGIQLELQLRRDAESLLSEDERTVIKEVRNYIDSYNSSAGGNLTTEDLDKIYFEALEKIPNALEVYDKLEVTVDSLRVQQSKTTKLM